MLGFSPLTSAPLADDGLVKVELTPVSVSAQAPSVSDVVFTQVHSLTSVAISTGTYSRVYCTYSSTLSYSYRRNYTEPCCS